MLQTPISLHKQNCWQLEVGSHNEATGGSGHLLKRQKYTQRPWRISTFGVRRQGGNGTGTWWELVKYRLQGAAAAFGMEYKKSSLPSSSRVAWIMDHAAVAPSLPRGHANWRHRQMWSHKRHKNIPSGHWAAGATWVCVCVCALSEGSPFTLASRETNWANQPFWGSPYLDTYPHAPRDPFSPVWVAHKSGTKARKESSNT